MLLYIQLSNYLPKYEVLILGQLDGYAAQFLPKLAMAHIRPYPTGVQYKVTPLRCNLHYTSHAMLHTQSYTQTRLQARDGISGDGISGCHGNAFDAGHTSSCTIRVYYIIG